MHVLLFSLSLMLREAKIEADKSTIFWRSQRVADKRISSSAYIKALRGRCLKWQPNLELSRELSRSLIKMAKRVGARMLPCLTPELRGTGDEKALPHFIDVEEFKYHLSKILMSLRGQFLSISFEKSREWLTLSKAFGKSRAHI